MKKIKGFTLIEFMVIIAIVGICASMLLPALAKRKQEQNKSTHILVDQNILTEKKIYIREGKQLSVEEITEIKNTTTYSTIIYKLEYEGKMYLVTSKGGIILHTPVKEAEKSN